MLLLPCKAALACMYLFVRLLQFELLLLSSVEIALVGVTAEARTAARERLRAKNRLLGQRLSGHLIFSSCAKVPHQ